MKNLQTVTEQVMAQIKTATGNFPMISNSSSGNRVSLTTFDLYGVETGSIDLCAKNDFYYTDKAVGAFKDLLGTLVKITVLCINRGC